MIDETPLATLVLCLSGQDLPADAEALSRLRTRNPALRLFAICIAGGEPPEGLRVDRLVRLPLTQEHVVQAEAIGLQLALNEGAALAGVLRGLSGEEVDTAARHFDVLASGTADVVVVPEAASQPSRLFVSSRAAFLASPWAALTGDLAPHRHRIASALLGLTARKGVVFRGAAGYLPLEYCNPSQLAPLADAIRQKLGLFIGQRRAPSAPPVRRVAVVTPYYKEPDAELLRMIGSVAAQSSACHHILVSDGFPNDVARVPGVTHVELGKAHADNGNTPRYVGAMVALAMGFDGVAFLDADNWFEPRHIERLVARQHETGAGAVFSLRNIYLPEGTKVQVEETMDTARLHVDTSCMLITRGCEFAHHLWGQMPMEWGPVCDRVVFVELSGHRLEWTKNRSMNFQSRYPWHYRVAGRPVPADAHSIPDALLDDFQSMPAAFRERAISRTGRVVKLIGL